MRFIFISIFLIFLPIQLFSQHQPEKASSVILPPETPAPQHLQLITPILLRNQPVVSSSFQNESAFWNHSAGAFFSSLIVPGSSQIANKNWLRAGLFIAVEALSIYMIYDYTNRGRSGE